MTIFGVLRITNSTDCVFNLNNWNISSVKVIYKQEIVEDSQKTKDIGLSWALSTMYRALA